LPLLCLWYSAIYHIMTKLNCIQVDRVKIFDDKYFSSKKNRITLRYDLLDQKPESLWIQFAFRRMSCSSSKNKDPGVILDNNNNLSKIILHMLKNSLFHLRNIAKPQIMITEKLVNAFMTTRLDYCIALLSGCPASSINKLQLVQIAVLTRSRKSDHTTLFLSSLHGYLLTSINYKVTTDL